MRHALVPVGVLAPMLFAAVAPLAAQAHVRSLRASLAVGASFPSGVNTAAGIHIQLGGVWPRSERFAVRGDLTAQMLGGVTAEPSCVSGPCDAYALSPDQVYSAVLSTEIRPFAAAPRLFALIGLGGYHGRGGGSTSFGVTGGASVGGGVDLMPNGGSGFVLEARYHRLMHEFGGTTGVLTSSLAFRF